MIDPSTEMKTLEEKISEAYRQVSAQQYQKDTAYQSALENIYEKLKDGKLVSKGFTSSATSPPTESEIPASHWRIIRFNGNYTEAKGQGLSYFGITVALAK